MAACFLAVLAFACFAPSLYVGFLSDDKQQFAYIYHYLQTQPLGLLQNFGSVWMQEPIWGLHYRPMMIIPLVFDVLVWNQNAMGWHVTTLMMHVACTVLMFFLTRKLLKNLAGISGMAIPFLAGALFAVHPLHAESVTWICGRVDNFCTLFYLSSFLTFLYSLESENPRAKFFRILSLCLSAFALFTKEIGASLPVILVWYVICAGDKVTDTGKDAGAWWKRVFQCFNETKIYWLIFIIYLCARTFALGTLFGGYEGFASVAINTIWLPGFQKWKFLQGVYFPVPLPQLEELGEMITVLICLYVTLVMTSVARFVLVRDWQIWRAMLFLLGWLFVALTLVVRVWYAASVLPGGRHFYLVSVPFCILSVLLVVPAFVKTAAQMQVKKLAVGVVSIYCFLLAALTVRSHDLWIDQVKYESAIETGISKLAKDNPQADRLVFLAAPQTRNHLALYPSFANLQGCLKEPLCTPDLSNKIGALRSHFFNLDLVNKSELATSLSEPKTIVFGWDGDKRELCKVPSDYFSESEKASVAPKEVMLKRVSNESNVATYTLSLDEPFKKSSFDCLEVTAIASLPSDENAGTANLMLSWNQNPDSINRGLLTQYETDSKAHPLWRFDDSDGFASSLSCFLERDDKPHTYRFQLSEIASWILFGKLSDTQLAVSPGNTKILSARFLDLENEIPKLYAVPKYWAREKSGAVVPKSKDAIVLNFDATKLAGTKYVMAEISKPFEYFEYFIPCYRQDTMSKRSMKKYSLEGLKGEMTLWAEDFKIPGEYDVRIAAFDKDGKLLGYVSDPVTMRI